MTNHAGAVCPFCSLAFARTPSECPRCGALVGEAALDLKRLGERERRLLRTRKAASDTLFLVGLLLGGPMMTLGGNFTLGSFIVLAGGAASVLRRLTAWSLPGCAAVGALLALLVAVVIVEPAHHAVEENMAMEESRHAYAEALDRLDEEVLVEGRGAGVVAIWFTLLENQGGECGTYPPAEIRTHLADLGFLRVVVAGRNQAGGLCSFRP